MPEPTTPPSNEPEKPKPYEDADKESSYQNFKEFLTRFQAENAPPPEKTEKPEGPTKKPSVLDSILSFGK